MAAYKELESFLGRSAGVLGCAYWHGTSSCDWLHSIQFLMNTISITYPSHPVYT